MKRLITIALSCLLPLALQATPLNIERWKTSNGANVLFFQANELPMVDISIAFKAGSAFDNENWGLATLTAGLINQGSKDLTATQIAEQFENYGAIYSNDVDRDKATFSLRSLSHQESLSHALKTLTTLLSKPSFLPKSVDREKQQLITTINYMSEKPASVANNAFYKTLYPNHPYGHSVFGTKNTIKKINRAQIQTFFNEHYTANNATIAIVGALTTYEAKKISNTLSLNLPTSQSTKDITPTVSRAQEPSTQNINFPSNQTSILIGQLGIDYKNPNYFPLIVGNYTLGGSGLISQLAEEVREKRGLTYGVYSTFQTLEIPGPFTISLATKTTQTKQALQVTLDTLNNFLKLGPTQNELNAAKQYLTGSFPLKLSSNKSIVNTLLNMGFYRLPHDYIDTYLKNIEKVTLEDIKTAFKQTIDPKALATVTVGQYGNT